MSAKGFKRQADPSVPVSIEITGGQHTKELRMPSESRSYTDAQVGKIVAELYDCHVAMYKAANWVSDFECATCRKMLTEEPADDECVIYHEDMQDMLSEFKSALRVESLSSADETT